MELSGIMVSIDTFGASVHGNIVYEKVGFTAENVIAKYKELV
ncbi:hypothetical protein [Priestia endophytica]|nr:hypothetical protein [Priestia endophytica]